jgi:ATP-binding cassette subfamily B protein RaxB
MRWPIPDFRSHRRLTLISPPDAADGGLACLAMVAGYYGRCVTLSELRGQGTISPSDTALETLTAIADRLGFLCRPLRLDPTGLGKLKTPCLLQCDVAHYVVLNRVTLRWVEIFDPAGGIRRLSFIEASQHFTGVALELTPAATFQKQDATGCVRRTDP